MGGIATVLLKEGHPYRRERFLVGLKDLGYSVRLKPDNEPAPGDVLLIWNRIHTQDPIARAYEKAGATVLVAEKGYIGTDQLCLAHGYHNGAGRWAVGGRDRWAELAIPLQEWRRGGDHILVLSQNGVGMPGIASPRKWADVVARKLQMQTRRPIHIRRNRTSRPWPLEPELENCFACFTWSSSAGIKAIVKGIPVFHGFRRWVGAGASRYFQDRILPPYLDDRLGMLKRLAWAQWHVDEISSGDAFECLLR